MQFEQAPLELAPGTLLNFPGTQRVQVVVPAAAQDPSAQHTPALGLLEFPAAQSGQAEVRFPPLPSLLLNVFAVQFRQLAMLEPPREGL